MNSNNLFGQRANGGRHGEVFTKPEIVRFMLDEVGYDPQKDLSQVSIMEPSCGEGEFVVEIVRRLKMSSLHFGFDFDDAYHSNLFASDIDRRKIEVCAERIKELFPELKSVTDKLYTEDYLITNHTQVDIVVGNPPYIRYEQIPEEKLELYKRFPTFYYRADIYIPFFEKSLSQLKPNGLHCFICSNRWMRNQYGKKLRKLIANYYRLKKIINLEGANAFQEDVLAYPAITEISASQRDTDTHYANISDIGMINRISYNILPSPKGSDWSSVFNGDSEDFSLIEEQNYKIGIGIATGADSIFISKDFKGKIEDELLLPVINARDLCGDKMLWGGRYFLNPYDKNGQLINLDKYPETKSYLEEHKNRLAARYKARNNPTRWYATIDAVSPTLLLESKILLPDISGNSYIFVDEGCYYPQHNIYYITGNSTRELRILAAILMSDFVHQQLDNLTNHMNGGYARWQSQYLRKLHIPMVCAIPVSLADDLLKCYDEHNIPGINYNTARIVNREKTELSVKARTKKASQQLEISFAFTS